MVNESSIVKKKCENGAEKNVQPKKESFNKMGCTNDW